MKILLTALLALAAAGCVSNKTYLYEKVPAKQFKIEVVAESDTIKGIFENTFKAELLKAGYVVSNESNTKILVVVSHATGGWMTVSKNFITSVSISLQDSSGKVYLQADYSQSATAVSWWGDQTPIRIARDTARAFVKKIKSS